MSRLIDADKLKERDFGEYGYEMRYEIDRQPTVQAIPLDKVKEARESVQKYINACDETSVAGINMKSGLTFALEILDELIESEEK